MEKNNFLQSLNENQRVAAEILDGPVLVLAGPGTGKTHLLTTRIAHLLEAGIGAEPQNILCLTFTESAATEMRSRLQKMIGNLAYRIKISTFHGFCQWVMEEFPKYFEKIKQRRRIADDLEKALAFQEVMKEKKWENFFSIWDEFQFRRDILGAISKLKRENISPSDFRKLIPDEQKRIEADPENLYKKKYGDFKAGEWKPQKREEIDRKIERMDELADFWESYERILKNRGWYDFDDQIQWVVNEVKRNENIRFDLAERFQWILVDEYQDTNSSQNQLIWALTAFEQSQNIFAVGDDDQSIYRFQGASRENMEEFREHFPNVKQVTLTDNYRSAQNILNVAFTVIQKNGDRIDSNRTLTAVGKKNKDRDGSISKAVFGSRYAEILFLVKQIKTELEAGTEAHEIAILVRENKDIVTIARELPKFGIPVSAQVFQDIFRDTNVKILILMLEVFASPEADEKIMELLHAPHWNISGENLLRYTLDINAEKKEEKISMLEFLLKKSETDESLKKILDLLVQTRKNYTHCRPEVIAEKLLYESGLGAFLSQEKNKTLVEDWQMIRKFLEWIREKESDLLPELLEKISLHQKLQLPVRPDPVPADNRSVHILTAHKAKGQEFEIVFLPGIIDGVWGNKRKYDKISLPLLFKKAEPHNNEDERRLFFVGLTRAKKKIFLSYASTDFAGKEKSQSEFWSEVPDDQCEILNSEAIEESVQRLIPVLLSSDENFLLTAQEKEILKEKVKNFVWSSTSLQNYLDCPRKFLYQNILRFPRRPTMRMALGTALHAGLERFMRAYQTSKILPEKSALLNEFYHSLRGQNLEKNEFDLLLIHGSEILDQYFETKKDTMTANAEFEFNFEKFSPSIDQIRITGKMDKIVFLDEKRTHAKIVDYKSGKVKSIPKGEKYWRQMVFYDLLAKHSKGIPWKVESCEIEFLTPEANGKFSTRSLQVSDDDRAQVMAELKSSHQSIQNLEFPMVPNPENDEEIEFWQGFGRK